MSTHASNPPPSQPEIQRILKRLVQYVARTFYEPKHIVLLDLLVRNPVYVATHAASDLADTFLLACCLLYSICLSYAVLNASSSMNPLVPHNQY